MSGENKTNSTTTSQDSQPTSAPQENKQDTPVAWSQEGFDFSQSVYLPHLGQARGQPITADVLARYPKSFFDKIEDNPKTIFHLIEFFDWCRARVVPTGLSIQPPENIHIHTPTDEEIQQVRNALSQDPVVFDRFSPPSASDDDSKQSSPPDSDY